MTRARHLLLTFGTIALLCSASLAAAPQGPGPARTPPPADQPLERTDRNSAIAHQELLEKARQGQGKIDLYFEGDSILRRWGALDYPDLLANFRRNFLGWNAADFAWGGDRTENILWRLDHGELEGLHPKVIVLQAGTNNIGRRPGGPERVADITRGIRAIVDRCRALAPEATIVLTAVFPRNDSMDVLTEIDQINANLETVADGRTIRFLNINDKLADANGKLFEGMMMDGLHPTERGYQIWADALTPMLEALLGPRATTDHAPPATGDPSARQR